VSEASFYDWKRILITRYSCAVSNRTPLAANGHFQPLYERLLATSVLRTDGISTQYTIRYQNGEVVGPIAQSTGHVHIQEREGGWQIFVPQNPGAREVCYSRELPHALASLCKIAPLAVENISHVLNSSILVIDELLEIGGVGMVPGMDSPPRVNDENRDQEREELEEGTPSRTSFQRSSVETSHVLRESGRVSTPPERLNTPSSSVSGQGSAVVSPRQISPPLRSISPAVPEENAFTRDTAYLELLNNVIRIARRAVLPHRDAVASGIGRFHPGYAHDDAFGIRSQGQMNHDFKIGAAGELFVSVPDSFQLWSVR
jgi:hypothetical protein